LKHLLLTENIFRKVHRVFVYVLFNSLFVLKTETQRNCYFQRNFV